MWALHLIACPAEQLGIELPEAGVNGISHEDLRRDVRLLTESADKEAAFVARLGQMKFEPVPTMPGCATRGEGERATVIFAPVPGYADEATAAAAVISFAKAWDLGDGPPSRVVACLGDRPGGERVEPFGPVDASRPAEVINYTHLADRVKRRFTQLDGRLRGEGG